MNESTTVYTVTNCNVANPNGSVTNHGAGALYFICDSTGSPHLCRLQSSGGGNVVFRFDALAPTDTA